MCLCLMWNIMPSSNDSEEFEFWKVLFQKHTNVTNCYNFSNLETRIIGFEWSQWWELDRCRNQPRYFRQYYKIILVGFRSFQLWIHKSFLAEVLHYCGFHCTDEDLLWISFRLDLHPVHHLICNHLSRKV